MSYTSTSGLGACPACFALLAFAGDDAAADAPAPPDVGRGSAIGAGVVIAGVALALFFGTLALNGQGHARTQ